MSDTEVFNSEICLVLDNRLPNPPTSDGPTWIAVGGTLSTASLYEAYRKGIFPWFASDAGPIEWWSPNPRCVLFPNEFKISRSLRKSLRKKNFRLTQNIAFDEVVASCSQRDETWITPRMKQAYGEFHRLGFAHSYECWINDRLVGGLYGVLMGRIFSGESMFSRTEDASKAALFALIEYAKSHGILCIDCQQETPHLTSLGAQAIARSTFANLIEHNQQFIPAFEY